jgi:hypothetical protein
MFHTGARSDTGNRRAARAIFSLGGLWIISAPFLGTTGKNISKKSKFGVESEKYGKLVSG